MENFFTRTQSIAENYFHNIYASTHPMNFNDVTMNLLSRVTDEINYTLTQPISKEEIHAATFSINPSKASGENGMTGLFYQRFLHIVGEDIYNAISLLSKWEDT